MVESTSQVTPNTQLNALLDKQKDYATRIDTNTTKATNLGRLNTADSLESQKSAAQNAARSSGRPWTNEDERQWAARATRLQQQNENAMTLNRDVLAGTALTSQLPTISTGIQEQQGATALNQSQQRIQNDLSLGQGSLGLQARQLEYTDQGNRAQLQAQQSYQQAQLQVEQARNAQQQAQQLSSSMYGASYGSYGGLLGGPVGSGGSPGGFSLGSGGGGGNSMGSRSGQAVLPPAPPPILQPPTRGPNPLAGFGSSYNAYSSQMGRV